MISSKIVQGVFPVNSKCRSREKIIQYWPLPEPPHTCAKIYLDLPCRVPYMVPCLQGVNSTIFLGGG